MKAYDASVVARAVELESALQDDERRAVVHYAVYMNLDGCHYGTPGKGWTDAGAKPSAALRRLADVGVIELAWHTSEQWWKARLSEPLGHAVAAAVKARTTP